MLYRCCVKKKQVAYASTYSKKKMETHVATPRRRRPQVAQVENTTERAISRILQNIAGGGTRRTVQEPTPADTIRILTNRLNYANKKCKYAWAKYYESVTQNLQDDREQYTQLTKIIEVIPNHLKIEMKEMADKLKKKWECPICMDFIETDNLEITNCGHFYCKECLENLKNSFKEKEEDKWNCAVCRKKHGFRDNTE